MKFQWIEDHRAELRGGGRELRRDLRSLRRDRRAALHAQRRR